MQPKFQYKEPPLLFRNVGKGRSITSRDDLGPDFCRPIVARGAAYADYDQDGDLDLLITTNDGPAYLIRNDGGNRNHWLLCAWNGTIQSRAALGAVVRVESASGKQCECRCTADRATAHRAISHLHSGWAEIKR